LGSGTGQILVSQQRGEVEKWHDDFGLKERRRLTLVGCPRGARAAGVLNGRRAKERRRESADRTRGSRVQVGRSLLPRWAGW
jgi:hypothetical protein